MMRDVNGVEEVEGSRIEWERDGDERSGDEAGFVGTQTARVHRAPCSISPTLGLRI